MKRKTELTRRLRSLRTLGVAVGAMKSISAHHFRETRRAVEPSRVYRADVERVAAWAGAALAAGDGPAGLLVIGGELGLCGGYNARAVAAAVARRQELGPGPTFCVGHRAATLLGRRGCAITATYAAPTSVPGITRVLLPLAEEVLGTYLTERLSSFDIVSSRFLGVGSDLPGSVRLLPLSYESTEHAPTTRYVTREQLASAAAREVIFITLYDLLLDAMACEHSARLVATQAAQKWVDDRSTQLERQLASARREASTQEVLEIAAGARARRSTKPSTRRRPGGPFPRPRHPVSRLRVGSWAGERASRRRLWRLSRFPSGWPTCGCAGSGRRRSTVPALWWRRRW